MMKLRYLPGYLWSFLTVLPGLLLYALAKVTGCVDGAVWNGPARIVWLQGRFADWMSKPNASGRFWYGHTVGCTVFLYSFPGTGQQIKHESAHVSQQMWAGPAYVLFYAVSWLWGLVRYRSFFLAYRECLWERDARWAAGEE